MITALSTHKIPASGHDGAAWRSRRCAVTITQHGVMHFGAICYYG